MFDVVYYRVINFILYPAFIDRYFWFVILFIINICPLRFIIIPVIIVMATIAIIIIEVAIAVAINVPVIDIDIVITIVIATITGMVAVFIIGTNRTESLLFKLKIY